MRAAAVSRERRRTAGNALAHAAWPMPPIAAPPHGTCPSLPVPAEQNEAQGGDIGIQFKEAIYAVDTQRPITGNSEWGPGSSDTFTSAMDVMSFSYNYGASGVAGQLQQWGALQAMPVRAVQGDRVAHQPRGCRGHGQPSSAYPAPRGDRSAPFPFAFCRQLRHLQGVPPLEACGRRRERVVHQHARLLPAQQRQLGVGSAALLRPRWQDVACHPRGAGVHVFPHGSPLPLLQLREPG